MKTQSFDGFHVGQQLSVPEIDQNSQYLVEAIIPGGMGVCIKLVNLDTRKPIALKGIQKELLSDRDAVERFKKELNIWYVCASLDGVVDTHGIVMINNIPYMASEWCVGGDLSSHLGDMTAAENYDVASLMLKRSMALGVDVYDYESLYYILKGQTEQLRYTDLGGFAENMRARYSAITKGLMLNRSFLSLCIAEVEFRCEVYENDGIGACEQLLANKNIKGAAREVVLHNWVDAYIEYARFGKPEMISNAVRALLQYINDKELTFDARAFVKDAYYWLLLKFYPSIRDDLRGKGRQVTEWLTLKQNGRYRKPLAAAEILYSLGNKSEAFDILQRFKDERNWYATQLWTNLLIKEGNYEKAIQVATRGTELMPEHREVWSILYHAYLKVNNVKEANRALAMAKDTWSREQTVIASLRKLYSR